MRAHRRLGDDQGVIAVVVAIFAVVMFGLGALVVDLGHARDVRRQAQSTADAAALAGAEVMAEGGSLSDAVQAVKDNTAANFALPASTWAGCTDGDHLTTVPDGQTCISFDTSTKTVRVVLPARRVDTPIGAALGSSHLDVNASADATWGTAQQSSCVVCVLTDYDGQNGALTVTGATGGGVAVNGNLSLNPQGAITAASVGVAGSGLNAGGQADKGTLTPAGHEIPHFTDPLAGLAWPPVADGRKAVAGSGACEPTSDPSWGNAYTTVDACTSFAPGVYAVTEGSKLAGNGNVGPASGVLFYFTCEKKVNGTRYSAACAPDGQEGGTIDDAGNGTYHLSGITDPANPYNGLVIAFDRNNTAVYRQVGNGGSALVGGIYGARVTLDNRGKGNAGGLDASGVIVVGRVTFSGQDHITDTYSGSPLTIPGPPVPPYLTR